MKRPYLKFLKYVGPLPDLNIGFGATGYNPTTWGNKNNELIRLFS